MNGYFYRTYLPYCLDMQADGTYTVVGRDYKPVGICTDEWVDYNENSVSLEGITPELAAQLNDGDSSVDRIYLYRDGSYPLRNKQSMKCYLEKIEILASLRIKK